MVDYDKISVRKFALNKRVLVFFILHVANIFLL